MSHLTAARVAKASPALLLTLGSVLSLFASTQAQPVISLVPADERAVTAEAVTRTGRPLHAAPANFRRLAGVRVGESANIEQLTLRFAASTRLVKIESTPDFKLEQGSCVEGNVYSEHDTCTLLVRFTPKGPGQRLGHITIRHTASLTPYALGLGGYGYAPVVSFTPSVISTVAGTYPASKGLVSGASNLAVDGGDTLYIADTGNGIVRSIDSSGAIKNLSSGQPPTGIAVDSFGEVFFSNQTANTINEIYAYGPEFTASGTGTDACAVSAPCKLSQEAVSKPGAMSMDPYDQLFFADGSSGAVVSVTQPEPPTFARLYDPFPYQTLVPGPVAVDSGDNLYSAWTNSGTCSLVVQTFSNAANNRQAYRKVAGGRTCGFAGDGGLAGNAEISNSIGQMVFDLAGNLYFADSGNQRVRRIDARTGIIRTIAGNGTAGYGGDNGPATNATLKAPTGIGIDSQGQVYVLSSATTGQVVRKVGITGAISFPAQPRGTASVTRFVNVANTGNTTLNINKVVITGANAADYTIDNNTTSCNLAAGSTLTAGAGCNIGVIFKPAAVGSRSAKLSILDDSVTGVNNVLLGGTGSLPVPAFTITSPTTGATFTPGTTVKFATSVTSTSGSAPTGTVTFSVDGAAYGSPVTIASGVASVNLTGLTTKAHSLSAKYSGDANYAAVGPISVSITVAAAARAKATVKIAPQANASSTCNAAVFSVQVTGASSPAPSGRVQLREGSKVLAAAALSGGRAKLTAANLAPGSHTFTAAYAGDAHYGTAVSAAFQQHVAANCQKPVTVGPVPVHLVY
jgi:hypothetical protein